MRIAAPSPSLACWPSPSSCASGTHDEIRVFSQFGLDLHARLPADPPSLVDVPIAKNTPLRWLAQVIHREGRRGAGHPGVCGIGRHSEGLLLLVVGRLGDPQSWEVDAGHGRLVELA